MYPSAPRPGMQRTWCPEAGIIIVTGPYWPWPVSISHYGDVIMGAIASQITSLTIVYPSIYSDADQRKHQSSASLAFVWGIHRGPVNSPHKLPVTRKMFPFDDVAMRCECRCFRTQETMHFMSGQASWKVWVQLNSEFYFETSAHEEALTGADWDGMTASDVWCFFVTNRGNSRIKNAWRYLKTMLRRPYAMISKVFCHVFNGLGLLRKLPVKSMLSNKKCKHGFWLAGSCTIVQEIYAYTHIYSIFTVCLYHNYHQNGH